MWPEHWPIITTFLRCSSQWVVAGMSGTILGLNYPGVEVVLKYADLKIPDDPEESSITLEELFDGIQTMEFAALKVLNVKPVS